MTDGSLGRIDDTHPRMTETPAFRIGPHEVLVRRMAGRWTATVDGRLMAGFFGTEAQASGAALLAIAVREREHAALGAGDTLSFRTLPQEA
jgi:hypothetical protein